ncbi:translation initiation factor IF-2 N-terminal domain-containing protein [Actinomadura meyerae]|uniref:translation initiation factor IF-2 N-terminal domain-containing protein n=1 Tax=Actinomadura meyerae TaxID=240840 RepID=UPI000B772657|nr:translation initiation factor IF-2 N-terminal domain-containing protein [Actinomadura meyerae]
MRVYELAQELDIESKVVMSKLIEMNEFARSASSIVPTPAIRKIRAEFRSQGTAAASSLQDAEDE